MYILKITFKQVKTWIQFYSIKLSFCETLTMSWLQGMIVVNINMSWLVLSQALLNNLYCVWNCTNLYKEKQETESCHTTIFMGAIILVVNLKTKTNK